MPMHPVCNCQAFPQLYNTHPSFALLTSSALFFQLSYIFHPHLCATSYSFSWNHFSVFPQWMPFPFNNLSLYHNHSTNFVPIFPPMYLWPPFLSLCIFSLLQHFTSFPYFSSIYSFVILLFSTSLFLCISTCHLFFCVYPKGKFLCSFTLTMPPSMFTILCIHINSISNCLQFSFHSLRNLPSQLPPVLWPYSFFIHFLIHWT